MHIFVNWFILLENNLFLIYTIKVSGICIQIRDFCRLNTEFNNVKSLSLHLYMYINTTKKKLFYTML